MAIKLDPGSVAFFRRQRVGPDAVRAQLAALESGYQAESLIMKAHSTANAVRLFAIRRAMGTVR